MNDFLPDSYSVPTATGNYMKLQVGDNHFRILSSPILGTEYWVTDEQNKRHPKRLRMGVPVPVDELENNPKTGKPEIAKHFWAMSVWNYATNRVEILELTQKGLQIAIRALSKNPKWGNCKNYDLHVTRTGEGIETEYLLTPDPATPLSEEQKTAIARTPVNLEALFDNGDPFAVAQPAGYTQELPNPLDTMFEQVAPALPPVAPKVASGEVATNKQIATIEGLMLELNINKADVEKSIGRPLSQISTHVVSQWIERLLAKKEAQKEIATQDGHVDAIMQETKTGESIQLSDLPF